MAVPEIQVNAIEKALLQGDLSQLSENDRLSYYNRVCESLGLNSLTKPFEYIRLNGKLTFYATKSCTEQLRSIHSISLTITAREKIDTIYIVTARAKTPDGREDESTGAVNIENLKGEALSNAFMKAETKAKRRVTLSICGLAMLDESEKDSVPHEKETYEVKKSPPTIAEFNPPKQEPLRDPGDYILTGGEYAGSKIKELEPSLLNDIVEQTLSTYRKKGRPLSVEAKRFIMAADSYLESTNPETYDSPINMLDLMIDHINNDKQESSK